MCLSVCVSVYLSVLRFQNSPGLLLDLSSLSCKYEEQKIIHLEKSKKQSEELEVLVDVLNEVKVSLNERIAKYGEEEDKNLISEYIVFDKNIEENFYFLNSLDQLASDSFSPCSTLTFKEDTFLAD